MIFKFAARNLLKRPFLNLVKVVGLSLALSGILLIVLFLKNELTYDSFHSKADHIYRFTVSNQFSDSEKYFARVLNTEYIPHMSEYFSEIENYVRLIPINGGVVKHEEEFIKVNQAFQCDSTFFKVFDAQLLMGNPHQLLNHPGSMVVSESFAKKVFGKQNPIGQILTLPAGQYYGQKIDFTIQGIMKDFPQNSHFHPEFIATPGDENAFNQWAWTYLLLSDHAPPGNISSGFKEFFASHIGKGIDEIETEAQLQNIRNIHLHSHKLREIEANSNMSVIYTLSIAALILLFIALINYVNLNIGMANFSEKYLFVSRVVGSSNWMSLKYFLYEGLIIAAVSMVFSAFITTLAHGIIQEHFTLNLFHGNITVVLTVVFLFILLSLLVGILPLCKQVLFSQKSSLNYRHQISFNRKGINKTLIVLQYTISIALIVAVIVIQRQTSFALQNSMGVEADDLVCFENVHSDVQSKFEIF
ncbi:hypothetical protein BH23BAC1_BH23BAC1_29540 [soil metagenome]